MRILWGRVVALVIAIVAVGILLRHWADIASLLSLMRFIGLSYATPEERTAGLIVFGLVVVFIFGAVRLVAEFKPKDS